MKKNKVKDENVDINPYQVDKLAKVPSWIKILLLRYWAAAAACFLLFGISELGLNIYEEGEYADVELNVKLILLLALFFSIFTNYVVRVFVRLMYNRRDNTYRLNLINFKGVLSFVASLAYNLVMAILVFVLNVGVLSKYGLVLDPFGTTGGIGIEPFTVGFLYIILDGVFIIIKDIIVMIFQRVQYKIQNRSEDELTKTGDLA
jgi:hypothetical protein